MKLDGIIVDNFAKCGNSVCPPLSEALVRANMADAVAMQENVAA